MKASERDKIDGQRASAYVFACLAVLAEESDLAVVMGSLTSLVTLVCQTHGITTEQFATALADSMGRASELRAAGQS